MYKYAITQAGEKMSSEVLCLHENMNPTYEQVPGSKEEQFRSVISDKYSNSFSGQG